MLTMRKLPEAMNGTKSIITSRWTVSGLKIPAWIYPTLLWTTIIRSFSYGIELLLSVTSNPISPLMAFANVFGIQLWGILMLAGVFILIIGLITRLSILVTIGTLLSAAVWLSFAAVLGIGAFELMAGFRFVIAALMTGITWLAFFSIQLNTYRFKGVPDGSI